MSYKWILEPYSGSKSRYKCPNCGRNHSFTRYVDAEAYGPKDAKTHTIIYPLDLTCGRCNFTSCGYSKYPNGAPNYCEIEKREELPKVYYLRDDVARFRQGWRNSALMQYLSTKIDGETLSKVCKDYCIGYLPQGWVRKESFSHGTIFWQIDHEYNIRRGKVMFYKPDGHRAKTADESGAIMAMWQVLRRKKDNEPEMCYFGQHLLRIYEGKPVGIVESEKTAVIAACLMPELVWLATNSIQNFNTARLGWLRDCNVPVVVYPDYDGYSLWRKQVERVKDFYPNSKFIISDFVKNNGREKDDLADILLRSLK